MAWRSLEVITAPKCCLIESDSVESVNKRMNMNRGGDRSSDRRTGQEESLIHREFLSKSNVAEVLLAFADGGDVPTLSKHLHNELLGGVLWKTPNEHSLTPWRALPCGWGWKVC